MPVNAEPFSSGRGPLERIDIAREGRVAVHIQTEPCFGWTMPRTVMGQPGVRMQLVRENRTQKPDGELIELEWRDEPTGLEAVNHIQCFGDFPITRRWVTIRNTSNAPWGLDVLHSAFIDSMP